MRTVLSEINNHPPPSYKRTGTDKKGDQEKAIDKIERLSTLKKAVIWSEVLAKPLGLRQG